MNKIKKRIYFLTLRHSSFLLPPVMEGFTEKVAFWDTLMYMLFNRIVNIFIEGAAIAVQQAKPVLIICIRTKKKTLQLA